MYYTTLLWGWAHAVKSVLPKIYYVYVCGTCKGYGVRVGWWSRLCPGVAFLEAHVPTLRMLPQVLDPWPSSAAATAAGLMNVAAVIAVTGGFTDAAVIVFLAGILL